MQAACRHAKQSCNNTYMYRSTFVAKMWANADQQTIDQHPAPENGWDLINNQYEIIWFEGLQFPDTLVPDTEDAQCEDDDSPVVQSSDEENGNYRSCH